jgi:hypothetical protein
MASSLTGEEAIFARFSGKTNPMERGKNLEDVPQLLLGMRFQ